ncbi:MAG: molecular chaperone DnaK [Leptolyngbya sp. SIO4C1]|nr:molecular chaperone DnaK [Leptolyngbya sp. SIO4C1]
MGKVVGIDLGTTNSVVAVMEGGKPVVIANTEGMRTTPSVVAFSKEGERLVGQMARRQAVLNPQNTFYGVKRFIGRKYAELTSESKKVPYTIRKDEDGSVRVRCPRLDKDFTPEEISAMILRKLADEANRYLGQPVTGAVITVPAYFNDAQRQATRDAGRIAGLEVKRILNEPTAAALAYGLDQQYNQTILVFDLGGGTFDVSILDVRNGVFEVKSTSGDTQLGGTNFDKKIVDWLANEFLEAEGIDLRRDRQALQRLTEAAEKAKIELSGLPTAEINLPFITATEDGPKHIETKLTRSQFESLCTDLIGRLRTPLKQALSDANLSPSQIDEVVLVGGASRMPMVQALVRTLLSKEPNQNVNPDEAVAVGAAVQAGILTQEVQDIMLLDVTPLSLGLETIGGVMKKVIPRNTTIPVRRSDVFSTSENNQTVVEVHVLQGEREMVADNKSLGRFKLMGIPPAPRGIPQVQVSFDIDANGILQVSALDKTTGREQSITVQEASNLSEDDIQRMIREAEEFADTDRLQRERIEKRNRAETLTFTAERTLREVALDFGLQFARDRRRRVEGLIQELRDGLERGDERGIDIAQADLQDEIYELNREAYLYDIDSDEGDLLGQIGGTLKRIFTDDEEDYRRDYGYGNGGYSNSGYSNSWERQAQWDAPSYGRRDSYSSSWDDWGDDWEQPRRDYSDRDRYEPPARADRYDRYDAPPRDDRYGYDAPRRPEERSDDRLGDRYDYDAPRRPDDRYDRYGYDAPPQNDRWYDEPRRDRGDYGGDYNRSYERPARDQRWDYDQTGRDQTGRDQAGRDQTGRRPSERYGGEPRRDDTWERWDESGRYDKRGQRPQDPLPERPQDRYDDRYDRRDYGEREPSTAPRDSDRRDPDRYDERSAASKTDRWTPEPDPWASDEPAPDEPPRDRRDRGYSGNAGYPPAARSGNDYGRRYDEDSWGDEDELW